MTATMRPHKLELGRESSVETRDALIHEVRRGLLKRPRSLAPWMFYDADGSRLFERITTLQEYYPARTERNIFAKSAEAIVAMACEGRPERPRLVELGAGTAAKTGVLLDAIVRAHGEAIYMPVDISPDALDIACEDIALSLPEVQVEPVVGNYVTHPPRLGPLNGPTLAMYIGSSIGNFSPKEARRILRNLGSQLQAGDSLLLGTDLVKDEPTLLAAYDDREGVTAAFNMNILHRLNRELGADFDPANYRHRAVWNRGESRIEMHLESTCDHQVRIASMQLDLQFTRAETIHTENSYKFTRRAIRTLLESAGFRVERTWTDDRGWYAVTLARIYKGQLRRHRDLAVRPYLSDLVREFPEIPRQPFV